MSKECIQFSHANGFPGSCYETLFALLRERFELHYIDTLGHNPHYPITDNWASLVEELIATIAQDRKKPVIGIGHSLGGAITFFAAIKRPELFKAIVLLDVPILAFPKAKLVQFLKKIGQISLITPGKRTERRRQHWSSIEEALRYFRTRDLFKNFTEQTLHDFVQYGTVQKGEERVLKFDRKIEAQIYHTFPHNYAEYNNQLVTPCCAIFGEHTHVVSKVDKRSMQKHFNVKLKEVPGGHLFPFEYPENTARAIKEAVNEMNLR